MLDNAWVIPLLPAISFALILFFVVAGVSIAWPRLAGLVGRLPWKVV